MDDLLANPAVQGGAAPFLVALIVAAALSPLRLGGLAAIAAFLVCMYFVSGIQFTPLTATRKMLVLAIAAAPIGILLDFALKPSRVSVALIALASAGGAMWAFWPLIVQKPGTQAWLFGGSAAVALAVMVGFAQSLLAGDGVRAGAAGLAAGLGVGVAAIFAGSNTYGMYGIALGAGSGAFLLPQMVRGKKAFAGSTFILPVMLIGGLVAAGAMFLAQLPWYCLLILALVPVGVRLPGPEKGPVWLQAVVFSLYGLVIAGAASALAWPSSSQP